MIQQDSVTSYPRHDIPVSEKNEEWGRAYANAAYNDWTSVYPQTVFYNAGAKYQEQRLYALGKQPINKYKRLNGIDQQTNKTYMNIDWSVRPVISRLRNIAISRMMQSEYGAVATPIDPTAKAELDQYYAEAKAKIVMRELLQKQNPELAEHPIVKIQSGEPLDMEELEMRIDFGEQLNRSKDAELAIALAHYDNKSPLIRKKWFEDFFDCGVAGYKEWLGYDNRPKVRYVDPASVITNYCRQADFSDLVHAGEVIDVSVVDLAQITNDNGTPRFSHEQLTQLKGLASRNPAPTMTFGNGTGIYRGYDKFKVQILDLEFYSWNDLNFNDWLDGKGNPQFEYKSKKRSDNGKREYKSKRVKVVYKIKWVIGTDMCYDFGLATDMKRAVNPKWKCETTLSYKFFSPNFYEMMATSPMEALIPFIDDYQMTVYKIQNLRARMVPDGWFVDLDALEGVALAQGGKAMAPIEVLKLFQETGVLVGRSKDVMGNNVNYKPVIPIQNNIGAQLVELYNSLSFVINEMKAIIGLNDITDASTPNAKTLNAGYENANASTNNALYQMMFGERVLFQELSEDFMMRTQQGLRKGGVEGYAPALNSNTLQFISVSQELSMRDYGIMIEEKTTEDQRMVLTQAMQADIGLGYLDTSDILYISNVFNVKQAQMILAYRVKKNKQLQEANKQAINMQTIQGQQQSAMVTEQAKQQTMMLAHKNDMELQALKNQGIIEARTIQEGAESERNTQTNQQKLAGTIVSTHAKMQETQTA